MQSGHHNGHDRVLDADYSKMSLNERLAYLVEGRKIPVFTTSLGIEDQVLTAALSVAAPRVRIVTLETGRLFEETMALIDETQERYGITIERFRPDEAQLAEYAAQYGMNGFYESVAARHACCGVRKLEPLARALSGADLWITGLRRGQSASRSSADFIEFDAERQLLKANPLADWNIEDIKSHVATHAIPINPLHARGYPSIGCEPCTRAIKPGEDERAGRWWWENDEQRECGLHVAREGEQPSVLASAVNG